MATNPYSLQFNGSNQYGTNQSISGLFGTAQYTLEAWFRYTSTPGGAGNMFTLGSRAAPGEVHSSLRVTSGNKLQGYLGVNGADRSVTGSTTLSTNTWYHGAAVYNGSNILVYLGTQSTPDVQDAISMALSGNMNSPSHNAIHIGCGAVTSKTARGDWFPGFVDEVRIWSVARTLDEINKNRKKRLKGDEVGLIGLWRNNEGSGTSVADDSPNSHALTLNNSPTWSTVVPFPSYESDAGKAYLLTNFI
jgi:hypothetical protein